MARVRSGRRPTALAAFRQTPTDVAALPCDMLPTPHPSASALWARLRERPPAGTDTCPACTDAGRQQFDAHLRDDAGNADGG